ncbi:hypothetical protein PDESU_05545 [Pontiella desulfatans]|uniref:Polymerase nucleotidyl transferase domain-containing protein n=1 Tax=Pontiella desulfatans TaxID=2750659 RepID=A0A6C2UA19_PONDE|nr:nucleotidyltransferase domain-containing protein [Pontiella desulfatans]VGO16952.1 hypothetical protein PDESU_05545 [Pontiella desulfatans]
MSKYTIRGSEALDARIDIHLEHIAKTVAPYCEAVVLLGGYGRGEGTPFIKPDGSQAPFNDYDLVVIVDTLNTAVRLQFNTLEKQLTEDLGLPVDLCPYAKAELPSREFSLLNYEMKHGHMVIRGDEHVLDAMPNYAHDAIPLSEGARLLLNRGKLLLDIKRRLSNPEPLFAVERIRLIKFIHKALLAFGDAALLAAGQYDISYSVKKERILKIGECPGRERIVQGYLQAVELKEWGDFQALDEYGIESEFSGVCEQFLRFMPWYRHQYSRRECSIPKAVALNLKWNRRLCTQHPRVQLYDAIIELLQDKAAMSHQRFYELQRRFS